MLRKLKWQILGKRLAARYNWCQGPVPGRCPAVEKHCPRRANVSWSMLHFAVGFYYCNQMSPVGPLSIMQLYWIGSYVLSEVVKRIQLAQNRTLVNAIVKNSYSLKAVIFWSIRLIMNKLYGTNHCLFLAAITVYMDVQCTGHALYMLRLLLQFRHNICNY